VRWVSHEERHRQFAKEKAHWKRDIVVALCPTEDNMD